MKKVLMATGIFPPDIGGPATYIPTFGEYLVKRNYCVEVITLSDELNVSDSNYLFQVTRLPRAQNRWLRSLKTIIKIAKRLRTSDLFFCNGLYYESAIALRISSFSGSKLVKIVGDPVWERKKNQESASEVRDSLFRELVRKVTSYLERKLITWSLRQFDSVTAPGAELAGDIERWDARLRVRVIENGVSIPSDFSKHEKSYDLVVLSRLVTWKNVDVVIKLASSLDCSLAIIGEGPQRRSLEYQARGNPKIQFFGSCTQAQVKKVLEQSKIFCQLSDYEGMSFSLLQAMAASIPCVLSDIEANKKVFESDPSAAIFVQVGDTNGTLKQLSELIGDIDKQRDLGSRAKRIAQTRFNEEVQMEKMMTLLVKNG